MHRGFWLAGVLLLLAPAHASGQTLVATCAQECRPQDADVNDPPLRDEGPVRVVLYAHTSDLLHTSPLTTQLPDPTINPSIDQTFLTPMLRTNTGTALDARFVYDVLMAPVPDRVVPGPDGRLSSPFVWTTDEVRLAPGPIVFYLYLAPDALPAAATGAGVAARLRVEATWEERVRDGVPRLLAHGATPPFELAALATPDQAAEVRVEMTPWTETIPNCRREGIAGCALRIRIAQLSAGPAEVAQRDWRLRAGVDFPWRIILPVTRPLTTDRLDAHVFNGTTRVAWSVNSAFGAYDVDASQFRLRARTDEAVHWEAAPTIVDQREDQDGPLQPWVARWDVPGSSVGEASHLELVARNQQGTYELVERREWPPDPMLDVHETPPIGLPFLLLVGLGLLRRRQTH